MFLVKQMRISPQSVKVRMSPLKNISSLPFSRFAFTISWAPLSTSTPYEQSKCRQQLTATEWAWLGTLFTSMRWASSLGEFRSVLVVSTFPQLPSNVTSCPRISRKAKLLPAENKYDPRFVRVCVGSIYVSTSTSFRPEAFVTCWRVFLCGHAPCSQQQRKPRRTTGEMGSRRRGAMGRV